MNEIFNAIQEELKLSSPELLPLFLTIKSEAIFGYNLIHHDLKALPKNAKLLEVGGGTMLLSCYLVSLGYDVVSVEPTGSGFDEYAKLRQVIFGVCNGHPNVVEIAIEQFSEIELFDYAYSINVMEHVDSIYETFASVEKALKPGATYRFFCPNYSFPYEPHFNIPTIFTKKITEKIFKNKIYQHPMPDPKGVWNSLNWITSAKVKRHYRNRKSFKLKFNREIFGDMLERATKDQEFAARRSNWLVNIIEIGLKLNLHKVCKFLPLALMPVMDCKIYKNRSY